MYYNFWINWFNVLGSFLSFIHTSNQNEIQISTQISWKEIAVLQNTKDDKIIILSDHGMTFWFRLFQKSSSAANIYMCHCYRTVTFHISSCFSFHSQFKSRNTTSIHNLPNIYCTCIWFNVLKIPKPFYVILLTDNWWIWFLYLQNQITLSADTMGKNLAVFRIWNLSDLKQKKRKKLVIGYHVPLPLPSMVKCKNDRLILSENNRVTEKPSQELFKILIALIWSSF